MMAEEFSFVTLQYPPLVYEDDGGSIKGVAVEIVSTIMTELGHSFSIVVMPWTRALKMVQFGKADAIFTIFKNAQREEFLNFSDEVLIPQTVAFYRLKKHNFKFTGDLRDLRQYKIGVVSTISYGNIFDQARPNLNIESTASLEQNFLKMMLGRIDLVINNVYSAEIVIQNLSLNDQIIQIQPSVENVPSYISFSKSKLLTELKTEFDKKLIELKRRGTYDTILKRSGIAIKKYGLE